MPDQRDTRTGMVLGAGGVLGAAWMTGALCALEDHGVRPADARFLVGTSAGAFLTAMVSAGVTPAQLRDHQHGRGLPPGLGIDWDHDTATGGSRPALPAPLPASPGLVLHSLRRPGSVPWLATLWAALPRGRGSAAALVAAVEAAVGAGCWAPREGVEIVATDLDTGRRAVFDGSAAGPDAVSLADAVAASCAAPLWFAPRRIGAHTYLDGGVTSTASADLLCGRGLSTVHVLAPLASLEPDRPQTTAERLERRWRRRTTRRLLAEVGRLAAEGTRVVLLTPGPEDLAVIGANLMDVRRRIAVLDTAVRTTADLLARRVGSGAL